MKKLKVFSLVMLLAVTVIGCAKDNEVQGTVSTGNAVHTGEASQAGSAKESGSQTSTTGQAEQTPQTEQPNAASNSASSNASDSVGVAEFDDPFAEEASK